MFMRLFELCFWIWIHLTTSPQAHSGEQAYDLSESRTLAGSLLPICCDGNYGISYIDNTRFPGSLGTVVQHLKSEMWTLTLWQENSGMKFTQANKIYLTNYIRFLT